MASSMIHLAITKGLTEERETKALERLFLGSILPDGAVSGNSHLKKCLTDNDFTYDLEFFRTRFGEQMQKDPLYLGYYLHLVQDLFSGILSMENTILIPPFREMWKNCIMITQC